jgi:hypothetical protein
MLNKYKMIPFQFRHNTLEGGTDVHFNIEQDLETLQATVSNIQFHSNYKSNLPEEAYIEYDTENNKYQLCRYGDVLGKDSFTIKVRDWLKSDLANEILEKIFKVMGVQNPKFTK